jgi:hypothetical protein
LGKIEYLAIERTVRYNIVNRKKGESPYGINELISNPQNLPSL